LPIRCSSLEVRPWGLFPLLWWKKR